MLDNPGEITWVSIKYQHSEERTPSSLLDFFRPHPLIFSSPTYIRKALQCAKIYLRQNADTFRREEQLHLII